MTGKSIWWMFAIILSAAAAFAIILGWGAGYSETHLFYWGLLILQTTALWTGIIALLLGAVALGLWFFSAISPRLAALRPPLWSGILMVLAGVILCIASVPALTDRLSHQASDTAGSHRYYLAYRVRIDNSNTYMLFECDSAGLLCDLRYVSAVYPEAPDRQPLSASLVPSTDGRTIDMVVNGQVIRSHPIS